MDKQRLPIGVFDSGIGGLTVLQQLIEALPSEDLLYFGDTARVPYGGKSRETIVRYAVESAIFLLEQRIKLLVIACNTVSAYALDKLRHIFNIPVVGVIEPGAAKAAKTSRTGHIGVLGTRATIHSNAYQDEIRKQLPTSEVTSIACPLLVPFVEEVYLHHPALSLIIRDYLQPLKQKQEIDTLVLGCTHYPLLLPLIQEEIGPQITIVDSASTCAEQVAALLTALNLANTQSLSPTYKYFVSDDPHKFKTVGQLLLGSPSTMWSRSL